MKSRIKLAAGLLLLSFSSFSQKNELKMAEKSLKSGNSAEAKETLAKVEYLITNAEDSEKANFYFLKAKTLFDLTKKKVATDVNLKEAINAYNELLEVEKITKKNKYSTEIAELIKEVKNEILNSALADDKAKKQKESAEKLYQVYLLDKNDPIMLYYAAGNFLNAKEYDSALEHYNTLKAINFTGEKTDYIATNKLSGKEESFPNKNERDLAVKIGTHIKPKDDKIPSKRPEISKYVTQIYSFKKDYPAAKKAIIEAKKLNPTDDTLLDLEGELYLKTDDFDTYKKILAESIARNPNDANSYYNMGVMQAKANNFAEAEKNYLKAIELKSDYKNAYMNLSVLKLEGEKEIIDQMNALGTSEADNKKYEVLKKKRLQMFKDALPYLEKASSLFSEDEEVKRTLLNIYNALDMTDKYKALKNK